MNDESKLIALLTGLAGTPKGLAGAAFDGDDLDEMIARANPDEGPPERGELLEAAGVTLGRTPPPAPSRARCGSSGSTCSSSPTCSPAGRSGRRCLTEGAVFMPYPTPLIPHSEDLPGPLVMVQPVVFMAGHLLDKWEDVTGAEPAVTAPRRWRRRGESDRRRLGPRPRGPCISSPAAPGAARNAAAVARRRILRAVNDLMPPDRRRNPAARRTSTRADLVLLDSGIFWLTNRHKRAHRMSMDEALTLAPEDIDGFAELEARYVQLVQRYGDRLWGYIELDQGGAVNKRRTRGRLESLGLAPIPVYHPLLDGWDYFDELAASYDRMCFGNIVQASAAARIRLLHALYERHRAYPDLWVHVLGPDRVDMGLSVPPDSCDSSTWISPLRWLKARTETAMLQRQGDLPDGVHLRVGDPYERGPTWELSFGLCSDAVTATQLCWDHAAARLEELSGAPAYPPLLPGEVPPCPPA